MVITFAERLRYIRDKRGYTQERLAMLCGLSQSTIANYESGTRLYTRNLLSLARVLGVSPLWLEKGQGNMTPPPLLETGRSYEPTSWPFMQISQKEYNALSDKQQQIVEDVLRALVSGFGEG